MSRVLIITERACGHSITVQAALMLQGSEAIRWVGQEFPQNEKSSFRISNRFDNSYHIVGRELNISNKRFDVVWFRRPTEALLPETLHPDDVFTATQECGEFVKGRWWAFQDNNFWVNSYEGHLKARSKQLQLETAVRVGLLIPDTLLSNDRVAIREFLMAYPERGVIFKTFASAAWWNRTDDLALGNTSVVTLKDIDESSLLQVTPGIFQQKISKAYELRVTFFGDFPVAAKLFSQEHLSGQVDWRAVPPRELRVEPYEIPSEITRKCIRLMEDLGIVFGCFDFIVTPDGRYYFLEVNQMGQFLWLERACPELPMLGLFTQFLRDGRKEFGGSYDSSVTLNSVQGSSEFRHLLEGDRRYQSECPRILQAPVT